MRVVRPVVLNGSLLGLSLAECPLAVNSLAFQCRARSKPDSQQPGIMSDSRLKPKLAFRKPIR